MKTIVAGSRAIRNYFIIEDAIAASGFQITELVSGGALGVDMLGERWAKIHQVPIKQFLPDWERYGKSAGHRRNRQMADYVGNQGGLIAIWDGKSRGTKGMIDYAHEKGLRVFVKQVQLIEDFE